MSVPNSQTLSIQQASDGPKPRAVARINFYTIKSALLPAMTRSRSADENGAAEKGLQKPPPRRSGVCTRLRTCVVVIHKYT